MSGQDMAFVSIFKFLWYLFTYSNYTWHHVISDITDCYFTLKDCLSSVWYLFPGQDNSEVFFIAATDLFSNVAMAALTATSAITELMRRWTPLDFLYRNVISSIARSPACSGKPCPTPECKLRICGYGFDDWSPVIWLRFTVSESQFRDGF